ncbi:hypothetical protein C2G38_2240161 [Gigaspora rosea]|uniref:Protein kinase domain-containing protein n=1 Tax=Gigaspora rosea TaxID=44941 RepID=A0A397W7S0_9GLOM|nr:hypothetical protein C2G38_2240161 [Gigaspora rosea]
MSATSNKFQQLQKYIIEKNINCYDYTRFRIDELIKNEEFTRVYRAVFKNKITVTLKSFENNELTINEVINELKLYHGVDIHPNIIRFNGVTRQEDPRIIPYMLIYEDVNGGTLRSYLHENSQYLSWNDMIKFSLQIANAVRYLHAKGIVNLGLHSENIFMHNKNIKLADYGLSNRLKEQAVKYQYLEFYKKSDVYTVGILMQEMYNNILFTENVVGPIDKYIKIYKDCLQNEPNGRPEIQLIVSNLKSLIVNCNQNISIHDLEIIHPQNSFIIQDPIIYNSITLQEVVMQLFNIEPDHTLESPTDLNNLLEIEPNNASILNNHGTALDRHYSIELSSQNDETFSSYQDNTNIHVNPFEITTLYPLYLPHTINSTISSQDYNNLENMRKEAREYFNQGKFLKALELYEEIIKNSHHSAEDQKSASTWDLSWNRCGLEKLNELIKALCKNTTLTSLNLHLNNLGSEGGKALADALCKNSTLTYLELGNNNLGSEGGKALTDALCKNSTLTSLELGDNNLGSEGGKALANALYKNATLTSLNLGFNNLGSEGGKALAIALCKNATLTSLNLQYNNLGLEEGKALANALCKNTTLTSLNLGSEGGKALTDILRKNATRTSLDLWENKLGSEGGKALANALCMNTTLTSLELWNNNLGSEGGKALANALCKNTALTFLNISFNKLGLEGVKALADALCKNTALTSLDLGFNNLGSEGGKALADALCKNTTLISLNLSFNNLGSEEGKTLANALCKNTTLTSLNLCQNNLGSEGGKALADALSKNTTLTSLNLWDNNIGSEGGKAFADALCMNIKLTSLDLRNNNLGPEVRKALEDTHCKNTNLTFLAFR